MYKHIENLVEATKKIDVSYHLAFTERGRPDIGIRKAGNDMIVVDDISWLIAGDIISNVTGRCITDVHHVHTCNVDAMRVHLRAQASVYGKIVQVHLGSRRVIEKRDCNDDGGVLVLA